MPIYRAWNHAMERQDPLDVAGIDARLAGWMDAHPLLLLEREEVALVGVARDGGPIVAIDQRGAIVVAQRLYSDDAAATIGATLAQAARIDAMPFDELDDFVAGIAERHCGKRRGVREIYRKAFLRNRRDAGAALDRVAFNARQRIVFVSTGFTPQGERTLRYLRFACGADVYGVQVGVYGHPGELTVETRVVVGYDGLPKGPAPDGEPGVAARASREQTPLDADAVLEAAILLLRRPTPDAAPHDDRSDDGLLAA